MNIAIEKQKRVDALMKSTRIFVAFGDQFEANKTPLEPDEKYVSLGHGYYIPKNDLNKFLDGMEAISKWAKKTAKENKEARLAHIEYELGNHEAWYTGDLDDTMNALGSGYTRKEVYKVYQEGFEKQIALRQ